MNVTATLKAGLDAHLSGQLDEAERLYLKALEHEPGSSDAWHLLGSLRHARGNFDQAIDDLTRAIELDPKFAAALNSLGNLYKDRGDYLKASEHYHRALSNDPEFAEALSNLGDLRRLRGDLSGAEEACRHAVVADPDLAEAHNNLGAVLLDQGAADEAAGSLAVALDLNPDLAGAEINLVLALTLAGRVEDAETRCTDMMTRHSGNAAAHIAKGELLLAKHELEPALEAFHEAAGLDARSADAANNIGLTLTRLGEPREALIWFDRAIELNPANATFLSNKGGALQACGDVAAALTAFDQALVAEPRNTEAQWNRGIARLLTGDLEAGFLDYEVRWRLPGFKPFDGAARHWRGESLEHRSILVRSEQGYGDSIHMIRYAARLAQIGASVVVETHPPLTRLLAAAPGVSTVIERGEVPPPVDYQIPMMSLPHMLGTSAPECPGGMPYLSPPEDASFQVPADGLCVGLAWAGRATHKNDRNRSIPLETLEPLLDQPGISFFGLQVGDRAADIAELGLENRITDLSPSISDFADTAAIVGQLDLVISADTALAHLTGALDRPGWVMLPFAPDWRWGLNTRATGWYPSLALYRQAEIGDWTGVVEAIKQELSALSRS